MVIFSIVGNCCLCIVRDDDCGKQNITRHSLEVVMGAVTDYAGLARFPVIPFSILFCITLDSSWVRREELKF